jgi:uncharacterized cupredoxin-like copper-binding protein
MAACGGADDTAATGATAGNTLVVTLGGSSQEFTVTPAATSVKAGKTTFTAINDGKVLHEMIVIPLQSGQTVDSLKEGDGSANEDAAAGEAADIEAGASGSVTVDLKPGTYALICNQPGHFAGGMKTTITVA